MQNKIKDLAMECLETEGIQNYTPQDLLNASLVFTHFFTELSFRHLIKLPITKEGREELAKEFGQNIHQTVKLATGVDLHEEAKK